MKHLKRSLALLLSAAMMLAVMAGCGGSASSAPAAEASKSEPAPAATEEAAPQQPQASAADETSSAAESSAVEEDIPELQLPLTEGETLSYWQTKPGGAVSNMAPNGYFDYPHFQEAAKLTGVTLDFIQSDFMVANEQFNLMIASQDYPDIFGNFNNLYSDGDDNGIE